MSEIEDVAEVAWNAGLENVELPDWLTALLPDFPLPRKIKRSEDGESIIVVDELGNVTDEGFTNIEEAYDFLDSHKHSFEITIDDSVFTEGMSTIGGMVLLEEEDNTHRALFTQSFNLHLQLLKSDYQRWLDKTHPNWLADSEDWVKAYTWLETHPVFWTRMVPEKSIYWNTDYGFSNVRNTVSLNENGDPVVRIQHGPHDGPEFIKCSLDPQLDVSGSSFEQCYVKLAKLVHKYYEETGAPRA